MRWVRPGSRRSGKIVGGRRQPPRYRAPAGGPCGRPRPHRTLEPDSGYPGSRRRVEHALSALRAPLTWTREPDAKRQGRSWRPGTGPDRAIGTASVCRSRRMTSRSTWPIHPECPHPCRAASLRADVRGERRTAAHRRRAGSRGYRPGRRSGHTGRAPSAAWRGQELQSRIAFRVTPHVPWGTRRQSLETTSNPTRAFPIMPALRRERNVAKGDGVRSPDHAHRRCTGKLVRGEATTTISYAHMFDVGCDGERGQECGREGGRPAAEWEWV